MLINIFKSNVILSVLLFMAHISFAQNAGSIKGNLVENKQAIEFATVTVAKMPDSTKTLHFTSSDSLGKFSFTNLSLGNYLLKVSLIGYKTISKQVLLSESNKDILFADLNFATDNKVLGEVVVTAQKKLIEKTNEGFIVNVATNISQTGGTATDLLKNTPTVAVDADGGITLRGKAPLILINGRNSNLTNTDQIPASSIESFEIINNASSKYDANAESGIINIKLKKNNLSGTNGAFVVGLGEGSRNRINSSLILNHKSKKLNIGLGYDNRFAGRTKYITGNRTNFNLPDNYQIDQIRNDERFESLQNLKLNLDFTPNDKNSFTFEAIGSAEGKDNDEDLISKVRNKAGIFNYANDRHSLELQRAKVGEIALDYGHKFENDKKILTASFTSSLEKGRENTDIDTKNLSESQTTIGNIILQKTHNYEDGVISNAKFDYAFPVSQHGLFETGYKGIFRNIKTDYEASNKVGEVYVINTSSSNIFNFNEQVHAVYALFHDAFGKTDKPKWKYDLGLRVEQVNNAGSTKNNSTNFTNQYLKLFPTANLTYYINENSSWKLNYGRRINRPRLGQLNPFIDITDALNPHSGNPNLKPELINALELGYNKEWDKFNLSSNLFYRHSKNTIRNIFIAQSNGVVLNAPQNVGTADSYGIENIFVGKPTTFFDFNASINLFQQELNGSNVLSDAVQSSFNWYGKLINNFSLNKGGKLQVVGNYTSAFTTPQGRQIPLYFVDLGFQQKLGKGNARLGLVVVDVFNTLKSGSKTYSSEFNFTRSQKADTRAIMLTFAYTFKSAFKEKLMDNQFSKEF
jgi:outer membrane receptor protein involved in Fe transport